MKCCVDLNTTPGNSNWRRPERKRSLKNRLSKKAFFLFVSQRTKAIFPGRKGLGFSLYLLKLGSEWKGERWRIWVGAKRGQIFWVHWNFCACCTHAVYSWIKLISLIISNSTLHKPALPVVTWYLSVSIFLLLSCLTQIVVNTLPLAFKSKPL